MWKEAVNMDYRELRKLKMKLLQKSNKTDSEVQLLAELQSLSGIIDSRLEHSLSLSTRYAKRAGDHCKNEGIFCSILKTRMSNLI